MGGFFSSLFGWGDVGSNPTINAIEEEARRKAQEEADVARKAQEEADRAAGEAAEKARKASAAQADAETAAREAEEKMNKAEAEKKEAEAAKQEAERKWKEGIRPEVWPTAEELKAAKERHQYIEGALHFAIAGIAGSGKSSLINAVRGLRNNVPGAAPTGVIETTAVITRYPDPNPEHPFVWYDVPGAGTLKIPDWEYFNAQGLYIFDCIIVLFDNRFTSTDVAILKNCARFKIPSYIVRSKSNQHIRNVMEDMGYESDDDNDRATARHKFIAETRESVRTNLEKAELPQQRVYIVAKDTLLGVINGKKSKAKDMIDEEQLVQDLLSEARARRPAESSSKRGGSLYHHPIYT